MNTKFIAGIALLTTILVIGAVFFLSKGTSTNSQKVSNPEVLVRDNSFKRGSTSPKAILVEFADFQCPACGAYHPLVKELLEEFKDDLSFVFRNFPLPMHKNAKLASYAAEAAGKQNKFWEYYDLLFQKQSGWGELDNAREVFLGYAKDLGLDQEQFKTDLDSKEIKDKIERDIQDGYAVSVNSTPTFFLNDEKLNNPNSIEDFKTLVKAAILKNPLNQKESQKVHLHADFKVYLDGKAMDFTQDKYQPTHDKELDPGIHLHDKNGEVIHVHQKGVTLERFFKSLRITFNKDCFILDTGEKYCSDQNEKLRFFVGGVENSNFEKYEIKDLDKIMIVYGSENPTKLKSLQDSVSDKACIYSEKCPEKGKAPTEECVGGLGTDCD